MIHVCGNDQLVPVLGAGPRRFVNLDNAASTPPLAAVAETVNQFAEWYSSVHRGAGFKSLLATRALEEARKIVLCFVGANPATHTALFGKNTTEAINRLAALFPFAEGDVVLVSRMEHHSNDLPWRAHTTVDHIAVTPNGELDLADLTQKLDRYQGRVKLVAISGASNVTGFVNPIHTIARLAHAHGAMIMVDAAQLAPHRPIAMCQTDPTTAIDFLVLSGHKMYAPYGAGALIGPKAFFDSLRPDHWGGGAVKLVSPTEVWLSEAPDRLEPGSPNTVGILAMARAAQLLMEYSMANVAQHEAELTTYALERLAGVPGIHIYGSADPTRTVDRVGVIAFNVGDVPHGLVAAILGQEGAIGVRNGCFCAHPYVVHLLGLDEADYTAHRAAILAGDRSAVPGMVRASFGCYSTLADVDALVAILHRIAGGEYREGYVVDPASGDYSHPDYRPEFAEYFRLG